MTNTKNPTPEQRVKLRLWDAMQRTPLIYTLDAEHNVIPGTEDDLKRMYADPSSRRVALDVLPEGIEVSTVFMCVDHGFGISEVPIVFETMIFGHGRNELINRYATWAEAEAGHRAAVAAIHEAPCPLCGEIHGNPEHWEPLR